jgi:hypothetical protein
MSSRQERRKAERAAAQHTPAQSWAAGAAGAAGSGGDWGAVVAAGAAAALAISNVNLLCDWSTHTEVPVALVRALGGKVVKRKAAAGEREAQYCMGFC